MRSNETGQGGSLRPDWPKSNSARRGRNLFVRSSSPPQVAFHTSSFSSFSSFSKKVRFNRVNLFCRGRFTRLPLFLDESNCSSKDCRGWNEQKWGKIYRGQESKYGIYYGQRDTLIKGYINLKKECQHCQNNSRWQLKKESSSPSGNQPSQNSCWGCTR